MKAIKRRITKLENRLTPNENWMNLGELYEWQRTPEGQAEIDRLYNDKRDENN